MDGKSLNIPQELLQQLQALVPQAFSEGKLDTTQLRTLLGEDVFVQGERYGLNWAGKSEAYKVLQQQTTTTLLPNLEQSNDWDTAQHVFIEGENLEVLKLLQKSYFGEVKMIYIDPPYNTGNDSFIYPDKFSETKEEYLQRIGDKNDEGYMLRQGAFRPNRKESGQYHSNWLNMMLPRLYLARNLLSDDGVIFVSIDENEAANLKLLMDEVFGEEGLLGAFVWKRRQNADNRNQTNISQDHEYIYAYSKAGTTQLLGETIDVTKYQNPDNDPRGDWASIDLSGLATKDQRPNLHYNIVDPKTGFEYPPNPNRGWSKSYDVVQKMINEGRVLFPRLESGRPREKKFLADLRSNFTGFSTILDSKSIGYTTHGTRAVTELFESKVFDFPKPIELIKQFASQSTESSKNLIILDFFAGSGTTAQAVMELNEEDGGNRKYICVQLPEKTDENSDAFKAGYTSIADITTARIQKVIAKIQTERTVKADLLTNGKTLPNLGFRKFVLAPSNFKLWRGDVIETEEDLQRQMQLFSTPQRANVTSLNMAWELLLKNKAQLTDAVQVIELEDGLKVYHTMDKRIALVLDGYSDAVQTALLNLAPKQVLLLDSVFSGHKNSDSLKTNAQLTCEDQGIAFKTI